MRGAELSLDSKYYDKELKLLKLLLKLFKW